MNLHSGSGTSPVSFLPDDFRLTLTLRSSPSPPEELPLQRACFHSLWLPDAPDCPRRQDSPPPGGSALRGGGETPARGPKSSTCRGEGEGGAVPDPPRHHSVSGALLSCDSRLRLCEGQISCCSGWSSPDICWCCTLPSHLELCSSAWRTGRRIWCAAPERRARGSGLTACCGKEKASAQSWRRTVGTGLGLENFLRG